MELDYTKGNFDAFIRVYLKIGILQAIGFKEFNNIVALLEDGEDPVVVQSSKLMKEARERLIQNTTCDVWEFR
jgi:hypothetical protein